MKAIIFSKDRPLQLDACLRSLSMHAAEPVRASVIWRADGARMFAAYHALAEMHPGVEFDHEGAFECDVRHHLEEAGSHVLFAVDDTVFVRRFSPTQIAKCLDANEQDIGFSLRLGTNTTHCYPISRSQALPAFQRGAEAMAWRWTGADGDFGYPLEVSSSIYRTDDILAALDGVRFTSPNELEHALALRAPTFFYTHPWLMSHETSVAFSVPVNRVQNVFANRAGSHPSLSAEALLEAWEQGWRIDVEALAGHVPRAAHEEIVYRLIRRNG